MSNKLNHIDMIDAYLTGQLSQEESSRLMDRIEQDPALKEEFLLQQDVVHSLQEKRKSELKARMDNINVGSGISYPGGAALKFISGTALVALIGTGIYFGFYQTEGTETGAEMNPVVITSQEENNISMTDIPAKPEVKESENSAPLPVQENDNTEKAEEISSLSPENKSSDTHKENIQEPEISGPLASPKSEAAVEEKTTEKAEVVKPEVISFFDEQDPSASSPEAEAPEDQLNTSRGFNTQNIEVTTVSDKKYSFHYMFFDNQLHIYGEFSKVPYEVLEVNTGSYTKYFLYHNGLYYELNPDQRKITRLKELDNKEMIKELEITRNEKIKH